MSNPLAVHFRALAEAIRPDAAVEAFLATLPNAIGVRYYIAQASDALLCAATQSEAAAPHPIISLSPGAAVHLAAEPVAGGDLLAEEPEVGAELAALIDAEGAEQAAAEAAAPAAPVPIPFGLASLAVRRGEGDAWLFAADATGANWTADKKAAHRFAKAEEAYAVAQPFGGYPSPEL